MDLMELSAIAWPSELEEGGLIHESGWQVERMRPLQVPTPSAGSSRAAGASNGESELICFGKLKPKAEAVDPIRPAHNSGAETAQAERKRREKLNQGFIQLSSLLPNLKKLDKASILAEAASYLKQLQLKVKLLEKHRSAREEMTRASSAQERDSSFSITSDENIRILKAMDGNQLLEVEARISDRDVLIKVHSKRNEACFPRVLEEIQKLNLAIINCNAMDYRNDAMVITILASMNEELSLSARKLVRMLQHNLGPHL